jgi:hypothetical protein
MRHLILINVINEPDYESGKPPPSGLDAAMGKLMGEWSKAGVLLSGEALLPTSKGARLRLAGGELGVTRGPFAETTEVIGGFFIVQTKTHDEAIELAKQFLQLHKEALGPSFEIGCEVRALEE